MSNEAQGPQKAIQDFIAQNRKPETTDQEITDQLLQAGWTQEQINSVITPSATPAATEAPASSVPTTAQPAAAPDPQTAQTGNSGTPLQVESVQYNMGMKPVESKVGLYIKIAGAGLWFTVVFVCIFLATLVQRIAGDTNSDLAGALVLTLSLSVVTTPIFIVAYKKFLAENAKNPATQDDIFFKKHVRKNLWTSIVFGAIAAVSTVYQFLSTMFLSSSNNGSSYAGGFSALVFTLGFGGIVYFYWCLHATTRR